MSDAGPPADRCPICGEANECGMAAGESTCWCFEAVIPERMLDRVPEQARDRACVCPRCASAASSEPAENAPSGE